MTLGIVKKNEQDFLELIQNEWGFLKLAHFNGERIRLEPYQFSFIFNQSRSPAHASAHDDRDAFKTLCCNQAYFTTRSVD